MQTMTPVKFVPSTSRSLITDLQSLGLRLADSDLGVSGRRGGAGPSDHKAITIAARPLMVPIYTGTARVSPFEAALPDVTGSSILLRDGASVGRISFPKQPRF